jgi:hypothetical protein
VVWLQTGRLSSPHKNAQSKEADNADDPSRLFLDAGEIKEQYPEDSFPGHSAWLDWPWKLHRIEKKGEARLELYNLAARSPEQVKSMKARLEAWLQSVVQSLNGKDY